MRLRNMCVKHSYYCSTSNYYSNEETGVWDSMTEFLNEFEDADIAMNLVFRWDIFEIESNNPEYPSNRYRAEVFIIAQREGIFMPQIIHSINQSEMERFTVYLQKHMDHLFDLWQPLTTPPIKDKQ